MGDGWVSHRGGKRSNVYVLCAEPKEDKHFRPGTRLEGSVTGVTEKLFTVGTKIISVKGAILAFFCPSIFLVSLAGGAAFSNC